MSMTDQELLFALGNEEPHYPAIVARLDESDVARVRSLAEGADIALASKAIYLASLLGSSDAHDIVVRAAQGHNALTRVASATGLPNLPSAARERAAEMLIQDSNPAVSKLVLRAIDAPSRSLAEKVRDLGSRSDLPEIRELARQKLERNN